MTDDAPNFPITAEIAGIPVITIAATEYASLLECRRLCAEHRVRTVRFQTRSTSPIARDPEVAVFLAEGLERGLMIREVRTACLNRFGAARTPSQSALHRYWQRLRDAQPEP
jgi:hypothetical protein